MVRSGRNARPRAPRRGGRTRAEPAERSRMAVDPVTRPQSRQRRQHCRWPGCAAAVAPQFRAAVHLRMEAIGRGDCEQPTSRWLSPINPSPRSPPAPRRCRQTTRSQFGPACAARSAIGDVALQLRRHYDPPAGRARVESRNRPSRRRARAACAEAHAAITAVHRRRPARTRTARPAPCRSRASRSTDAPPSGASVILTASPPP